MSRAPAWRPPAGLAADLAAALLLWIPLILPNRLDAVQISLLRNLPLEWPVIVLALLWAGRAATPLRFGVTALLTLLPVFKLSDMAAYAAYGRPFNIVLDLHLVPASWNLLSGTLGMPRALAAGLGGAIAVTLLAIVLWWATGRLARRRARLSLAGPVALAALVWLGLDLASPPAWPDPPGTSAATQLLLRHAGAAFETRRNLAEFREDAAEDRFATVPPADLLTGLEGRDVIILFVESYGRAAIEAPLYAPTLRPTLRGIEADLEARGLAMRSGFLTAPMVGGQSWLAHASVLSGLRIDNERRYRALIASPRRTLLHLAARAGWQTVAVMPAITLAWPEGTYFGYDRILAAQDLGYLGKPFNWVTMPDQYTLSALERMVLHPRPRDPVFAEVALISSHAPWTPIPPLLDWDEIGDGRVFDPHAEAGDPPEVIWRDEDRIRDQYRLSLEYALRTIGAFAARQAQTPPLIVVLGDHQPSTFVSGDPSGRDVPIHVIGPPEVIARIAPWGWTPGMLPDAGLAPWPMNAFRDRFLAAFGPPTAQPHGEDG